MRRHLRTRLRRWRPNLWGFRLRCRSALWRTIPSRLPLLLRVLLPRCLLRLSHLLEIFRGSWVFILWTTSQNLSSGRSIPERREKLLSCEWRSWKYESVPPSKVRPAVGTQAFVPVQGGPHRAVEGLPGWIYKINQC